VSDTHTGPSSPTVDAAMSMLRAFRDQVGDMARGFEREDPRRELLLAVWGGLDKVSDEMRKVLTTPVPARHGVGETTEGWRRGQHAMPRNRGPA
jgi:hypothetical protein